MQHRQNTGAMSILPMITLLREFLIVLCVLCVPQVDSSLYQIKHCLMLVLYGKYSTQRVVSRRNIALGFASCYICLSPTLFMLYFPYSTCGSALSSTYIYIYHFHTSLQREEKVYKWYNSIAISAQECINKK